MELDKQEKIMFNFTQPVEKEKIITKKEKLKKTCIGLKNKFLLIGQSKFFVFILFNIFILGITLNINIENLIKPEKVKNNLLIENQQLIDHNKIEFEKIKEEKNIKMWNEQVSQLKIEDLEKISNFMKWHEDRNIDKAINLYWSLVYVNEIENKGSIDMTVVHNTIKTFINKMHNHYSYRRSDMYWNYNEIKSGKLMNVRTTYDNQNVSENTLNWLQYKKTKSTFYSDELNILTQDKGWGGIIVHPEELVKYLEQKKAVIAKSKELFLD